MMNSINLFLALSVMIVSFSLHAYGLECHVCREQETNNGKCQNTVKICEQDEDACLTEIKWGSPPYWSQGALKQYYITKRCAKLTTCERMRKMLIPYCTNIWYQDWRCSDCCQGDRCNYFVFILLCWYRHVGKLFICISPEEGVNEASRNAALVHSYEKYVCEKSCKLKKKEMAKIR